MPSERTSTIWAVVLKGLALLKWVYHFMIFICGSSGPDFLTCKNKWKTVLLAVRAVSICVTDWLQITRFWFIVLKTILLEYFEYFVTKLSFFRTPQIVSGTTDPIWKIRALKVSCNFVADFRWPHSFLWTATASSSSSGFPVSTMQQSCNTQLLLSMFL